MGYKPIILTFVAHYLPGFKSGGPVRTIANMVEHLGNELDFRIVTADRDALDTSAYPGVEVDAWNIVGKAHVYYSSPSNRSVSSFARLLRQTPHDALYLNSFFDPVFTLGPLLARYFRIAPRRPCVIAPRGEFSAGAISIKYWRKRSYISSARTLKLYNNLIWQASSEYEAEEIRTLMGLQARRIIVAIDLPPIINKVNVDSFYPQEDTKKPNELKIIFLSRISPKKNLIFALKAMKQVNAEVVLDIYGPIYDESYWTKCEAEIRTLPKNINARYRGVVRSGGVPKVMAEYDLFFFPTLGENYGHVIREALDVGTPVLISDKTPWRDLEGKGVGWDLSLDDSAGFAVCIDYCANLDSDIYRAWRSKVRDYAEQIKADSHAVEANRSLFTVALWNR